MLAVLNPRGRDPEQNFPDGPGAPSDAVHPPVNFHAYAACTNGAFYRKDELIPDGTKRVLILLRRDLKSARQPIIDLRREGKTVAVSLKESGAEQVGEMLSNASRFRLFRELCQRADGAVAATDDLVPFYRAAGARAVEFIPTPYPVEDARWDFSVPYEERRGIFIGTREFMVSSRRHLAALLIVRSLAEAMGEPVTVINTEGWKGRGLLEQTLYPEGFMRVIDGRLPYPRYLRLLAQHKIVFQLDASGVPGQVAGDALLARVPCVGGSGAIERLAFSDLCGHGRGDEHLFDLAARLLEHPHDCQEIMETALGHARLRLGFAAGAKQLESFYRSIQRSNP